MTKRTKAKLILAVEVLAIFGLCLWRDWVMTIAILGVIALTFVTMWAIDELVNP